MRVAYENMMEEYAGFIASRYQVPVLAETDQTILLFVPATRPFDHEGWWRKFLDWRYGDERLHQTFVLLMNSVPIELSSVPKVPIITAHQKNILSGLLYNTLKGIPRHSSTYEHWKAAQSGEIIHQLEHLAQPFNRTAVWQVGRNAKAEQLINCLEELLCLRPEDYHIILPLLQLDPFPIQMWAAGDKEKDICYSCGKVLKSRQSLTANKLVFSAPSQRPQSSFSESEPIICYDCAAIGFASPIKLVNSGIVATFRPRDSQADVYQVEDYIRQFTLAELNLVAGRRLLISSDEVISRRDGWEPLSSALGAVQFAHYKLARLLPVEAFQRYQVLISCGGIGGDREIELQSRHLIWLRLLLERFNFPSATRRDQNNSQRWILNQVVADAIRYVMEDQVTYAEYVLSCEYPDIAGWRHYQADKLHRLVAEELERT